MARDDSGLLSNLLNPQRFRLYYCFCLNVVLQCVSSIVRRHPKRINIKKVLSLSTSVRTQNYPVYINIKGFKGGLRATGLKALNGGNTAPTYHCYNGTIKVGSNSTNSLVNKVYNITFIGLFHWTNEWVILLLFLF